MRCTRTWLAALCSSFCLAMLLSASCGVEQDYPATAFRCDPSAPDSCPGTHVCCSTDPASLDLASPAANALPDFAGGPGTPVFSGVNNQASQYGRCVDLERVEGPTFVDIEGLADGCPLPCNPTWDTMRVTEVCGADAFCCQTEDVGERDCVLDPGIGAAGCWRPVDGNDIETLGGLEATTWARQHDTHQDPRGLECQAFVAGLEPGSSPASETELLHGCYRKLTAANQRGLCTPAGGETDVAAVCGLADPDHRDACEQLNDEDALAGCD